MPEAEVTQLFEEILYSGAQLRVKVTGESMKPYLRSGDIVTIKNVSACSLRIGDLVFFRSRQGKPLLHRLLRKTRMSEMLIFQTKGDARIFFDTPVEEKNILGKVYKIEKKPQGESSENKINLESSGWKIVNYLLAKFHLMKAAIYYVLRLVRD